MMDSLTASHGFVKPLRGDLTVTPVEPSKLTRFSAVLYNGIASTLKGRFVPLGYLFSGQDHSR